MPETVGESLAQHPVPWGVDTVFGLPGDGLNGLMEGYRRLQEKLTCVLVHHEEAAAFMATGYAKATDRLGVCTATSGPRAIREPVADFAAWARACGGYGAKGTKAAELPGAVREALAHRGPALVDCDVNPNEPPMPGTIEDKQAKAFAEAFLRGQPHQAATVSTIGTDKLKQTVT